MEAKVFSATRNSIGFQYKFKTGEQVAVTYKEPTGAQKLHAQKLMESGKPSELMEYVIESLGKNLEATPEIVKKIVDEQNDEGDAFAFFQSLNALIEEARRQKKQG